MFPQVYILTGLLNPNLTLTLTLTLTLVVVVVVVCNVYLGEHRDDPIIAVKTLDII